MGEPFQSPRTQGADPQPSDKPAPQPEPESSGRELMVIEQPDDKPAEGGFWTRLLSFFRGKPESIRSEITEALSGKDGDLSGFSLEERAMLNNILRLSEVRVSDVMISRSEIEAVEMETSLGDVLVQFEQSGHSRMPVYCETLDDPRGMVHIRDVLAYLTRAARPKRKSRKAQTEAAGENGTESATPPKSSHPLQLGQIKLDATIGSLKLWRPVLFVPPSMPASELMKQMQARRIQMALVIDEYGGTDGLASLEDIVEMVVGDIEDEHDEEEAMISAGPDGSFVVDARTEIDEVRDAIGEAFSVGDEGEDVDTIGGLVVAALGRLPLRGEIVRAVSGFEMEILAADARRVRRIRIRPVKPVEIRRREKPRNASEA